MSGDDNNNEAKPIGKRRWLRWLIALSVCSILFISLLPIAVRQGAIHLMKKQGIQQVDIGDVDINLFSGEVVLNNVSVSGDGQAKGRLDRLYLNLAMLELFKKRARLQAFTLNGLILDIKGDDNNQWTIAGITLPASEHQATQVESDSTPWGVAIDDLRLGTIDVVLALPKLTTNISVESFKLANIASWLPQQQGRYNASLHIDDAGLNLSGQMQPFLQQPRLDGLLKLDGLSLAMAKAYAEEAGINALDGRLNLQTEFEIVVAQQPLVNATLALDFNDLALQQAQYQMKAKTLALNTKLDYLVPESEQDLGIRLNGSLEATQLNVYDRQAKLTLLLIQRLQLQGLNMIEAQQTKVAAVDLQRMRLISKENKEELLKLSDAGIGNIEYDGQRTVAIGEVKLQDLNAEVQVQKNGRLHLVGQLTHNAAPDESPESARQEEPGRIDGGDDRPWRVKLSKLIISDNSEITFADNSITPPYLAVIKPLALNAESLDTGEPLQAMQIALDAVINEHEKFNLKAAVRPFGDKLNAKGDIEITAVELPPLSPYIEKHLGYYIRRGQLNGVINVIVNEDQLDTRIHAILNKFNVEDGDPAKVKSMTEALSMPLDKALDLLRDRDDNIKLELTIRGDINDPQFDARKVINKALANGTKKAVTSYLKYALQPWGALITVAGMLGEASKMRFESVVFEPGQSELKSEHKAYLGKIAGLLQERPKLVLNICGITSEQDRDALLAVAQQAGAEQLPESDEAEETESVGAIQIDNSQLISLASERGKKVKNLLIDAGIDTSRLFTCQPHMKDSEKSGPDVELFL